MDIKQLGNSSTQALDSRRTDRQAGGGNAVAGDGSAAAQQESKLQISPEAQTIKNILSRLDDVPDVDHARVSRIKSAIDEGRYQASSERIADKLLGRDADDTARKE